jgi:hypothetical protein
VIGEKMERKQNRREKMEKGQTRTEKKRSLWQLLLFLPLGLVLSVLHQFLVPLVLRPSLYLNQSIPAPSPAISYERFLASFEVQIIKLYTVLI